MNWNYSKWSNSREKSGINVLKTANTFSQNMQKFCASIWHSTFESDFNAFSTSSFENRWFLWDQSVENFKHSNGSLPYECQTWATKFVWFGNDRILNARCSVHWTTDIDITWKWESFNVHVITHIHWLSSLTMESQFEQKYTIDSTPIENQIRSHKIY